MSETFVHIHPFNLTHDQLTAILAAGWKFYSVHSLREGGVQWDFCKALT